MGKSIKEVISNVIKEVVLRPNYDENLYTAIAEQYHHGAAEYYQSEKDKLIMEIPEHSMFGNAWIRSGCEKIKFSVVVEFYKRARLHDPIFKDPRIFVGDYYDFVKDDFSTFMYDYYKYNRFLIEIRKRDPNPISLGFKLENNELLSLFDKFKEEKCIDKETDFDYFKYAFKGDGIPSQKQPYHPIQWLETNKRLYYELRDIEKEYERIEQDCLTNSRTKVQGLFLDKKGKPMKELSTPR